MKTKRDITKGVMRRVVEAEKKAVFWRFVYFGTIFAILVLAFFIVSALFILDAKSLGTWDILSLFWEDREVIREYWQDAFLTIWLELTTEYIVVLFGIIVVLLVYYYGSLKKRTLLSVKSQKLASYEKSSKILKERNTQ